MQDSTTSRAVLFLSKVKGWENDGSGMLHLYFDDKLPEYTTIATVHIIGQGSFLRTTNVSGENKYYFIAQVTSEGFPFGKAVLIE